MRTIINKLVTRAVRIAKGDSRQQLLQDIPKGGICAEIGVWKGDFSHRILKTTKPSMLHLIDPWRYQPEFPERMYGGSIAKGQRDMDEIYAHVQSRFSANENVTIHKNTSEGILPTFPDSYFDWVYIDGNHSYECVLADLRLCLSKVKPGGLITGDDFTWGKNESFPVKRAVLQFVVENSLEGGLNINESQFLICLSS